MHVCVCGSCRCWTVVPVPTGQRGRKGCWACRRCSRINAPSGQPWKNRCVYKKINQVLFLIWLCLLLTCSRVELKRLCEIFTRMFADPHSKVWLHAAQVLDTQHSFTISHQTDSSFTHFDFILVPVICLSHHPSLYRILPKQSQGSVCYST